MKFQVILKEAKGGSVQVINNVKRIKDGNVTYKKINNPVGNPIWKHLYYTEWTCNHSHHCMKEYIVQQIHAGKTVKIEGEVMVIE
jgi:hypothetical protein